MSVLNEIKSAVGLGDYKASVIILGKKFESVGTSVFDALSNLKPTLTKGKGVLTITKGDRKKERILSPMMVIKMFSQSPMTRQIAIKNVCTLFDL